MSYEIDDNITVPERQLPNERFKVDPAYVADIDELFA